MEDQIGSPPPIETSTGPVFVFQTAATEPEIPGEDGRECPQCKRTAWRRTRWCWSCGFDFDRAALPRIYPSKIAFLSLMANALLCFILGFVIYTAHRC
jgi:hypothetical protein